MHDLKEKAANWETVYCVTLANGCNPTPAPRRPFRVLPVTIFTAMMNNSLVVV